MAEKKLGGGGECWKIDSNQLPVDVNAVATDAHGSTHGKIFVGGKLKINKLQQLAESKPPI